MGATSSAEIEGTRVFKVNPRSPAAEAGLEPYFDFVQEINGVQLGPDNPEAFSAEIKKSENAVARLRVYNTRSNVTREVVLSPRPWAGTGLLGASVRYDAINLPEAQGIRVLEVFPNSPAAHAGLVPYQDYMLGSGPTVFRDLEDLVDAVSGCVDQRVQVQVYNSDSEAIREVTLVPNRAWGGEGLIGCDIGTGMLHKIPAPRRLSKAGDARVPTAKATAAAAVAAPAQAAAAATSQASAPAKAPAPAPASVPAPAPAVQSPATASAPARDAASLAASAAAAAKASPASTAASAPAAPAAPVSAQPSPNVSDLFGPPAAQSAPAAASPAAPVMPAGWAPHSTTGAGLYAPAGATGVDVSPAPAPSAPASIPLL
mmetsp:Transcript_2575/g.5972  ORF Transcript_2575/g.5972 Transcript_2575/m.5972 type:complete len:373 (+) Transcript_2575:52-1170(+)